MAVHFESHATEGESRLAPKCASSSRLMGTISREDTSQTGAKCLEIVARNH
ncbi:MAG: hypothetical protein JWP25_2212 [Bradyrhizobium sp.]|jgi:hypothetical protein|nr:hypothetical protein [Bradyrhizobium sp.]